ncbi:MAG: DUF4272 domain-containing protein [Myxococcaceae bacterium]
MAVKASILVPLKFFPSREQLEPLCPDGFLDVKDFDETADIKWKGLSLSLSRVQPAHVGAQLMRVVDHANQHGGNAALETRLLHTLAIYELEVSPDFDEQGRAMRVVSGIVDAADGLFFFDGELFASGGRALLLGGEPLEPPSAERVKLRAQVLLALSMRGLLDQDAGTPNEAKAEELRQQLHDWCEGELLDELETEERVFLATPIGQVPPQLVIDAVWRAEGAQVLLWALGARALPAHDAQEHPYTVAREAGVMAKAPAALERPKLRPLQELEAMRKTLLGLHWRIREHGVQPGPRELARIAASHFGGFSIAGVALAEGDLSIKGQPLSKAAEADVSLVRSIAHERHLAANWLIGTHESYARVNTPT